MKDLEIEDGYQCHSHALKQINRGYIKEKCHDPNIAEYSEVNSVPEIAHPPKNFQLDISSDNAEENPELNDLK